MLMGGEDLQHQQHKNSNNIDLQLKADDNSPPPVPSWAPPPDAGGGGSGGGGGAKTLFEVSAVFAVILLSASVLCALGSALLEVRLAMRRMMLSFSGRKGGKDPVSLVQPKPLLRTRLTHTHIYNLRHSHAHIPHSSRACRGGTT